MIEIWRILIEIWRINKKGLEIWRINKKGLEIWRINKKGLPFSQYSLTKLKFYPISLLFFQNTNPFIYAGYIRFVPRGFLKNITQYHIKNHCQAYNFIAHDHNIAQKSTK